MIWGSGDNDLCLKRLANTICCFKRIDMTPKFNVPSLTQNTRAYHATWPQKMPHWSMPQIVTLSPHPRLEQGQHTATWQWCCSSHNVCTDRPEVEDLYVSLKVLWQLSPQKLEFQETKPLHSRHCRGRPQKEGQTLTKYIRWPTQKEGNSIFSEEIQFFASFYKCDASSWTRKNHQPDTFHSTNGWAWLR